MWPLVTDTAVEAPLMPVLGRVVVAEPDVIMSWIGVVGELGMAGMVGIVSVSGIAGGGGSVADVSMRGIGGRTGG